MKALLVTLGLILAAQTAAAQRSKGKILVVVSSENQLPLKNGKTFPTGYYLNELGVPSKALADAGFELVFANPKGNTPSMDVTSDNIKYFGGDAEEHQTIQAFVSSLRSLRNPHSLADVIAGGLDQYAGIFVPGGHAPMIDLMASPELGIILRYFHQVQKPTALICHGPVSILSAVSNPALYQEALIAGDMPSAGRISQGWIYAGYQMTVFSTAEEKLAEAKLGGPTLFFPEDALREAGGLVSVAAPWQSHVVVDRELITGQNPFSDKELAEVLVRKLLGN